MRLLQGALALVALYSRVCDGTGRDRAAVAAGCGLSVGRHTREIRLDDGRLARLGRRTRALGLRGGRLPGAMTCHVLCPFQNMPWSIQGL